MTEIRDTDQGLRSTQSALPVYDKAFAAYRALCELEDELDARTAAGEFSDDSPARRELVCLYRRWEQDTQRKVERALAGVPE